MSKLDCGPLWVTAASIGQGAMIIARVKVRDEVRVKVRVEVRG